MATGADPIDLKLYHDLKDVLQKSSSTSSKAPPKPGAFTLFNFPEAPKNPYDLVYDGIYLGGASVARKPDVLKSLGVTHVVNAAHGSKYNQIDTSPEYYQEADITFHGIPALDIMTYKILPHLRPPAEFMQKARQNGGVLYVHCQQGVSRSATVILAYLMLHQDYQLLDAVRTLREKREIFPNDGFLKQLCVLDKELKKS
ncbi:hypothetical protein BaRGS_00003462 [Batillaria attramentaria]|uniref:Dual specificity protein phosphatase n=1 Tax=Batillaria attramentaria TaxID=370345 RepID=A0ABD0M0I9_9CAEN